MNGFTFTRTCSDNIENPCIPIQLRKLLSRIRNQDWKTDNRGDGFYGSNDWYGGKLGEEDEDPDWDPREFGNRKRKRARVTDWDGSATSFFVFNSSVRTGFKVLLVSDMISI